MDGQGTERGEEAGAAASPRSRMTEPVLVGLGSNLDRPVERLAEAVRRLAPAVEVLAVSAVYRTEPVGFREQPDFYNAVVAGCTGLEPGEVLAHLHAVEEAMGRRRSFRNAPRVIDLDLLAVGGRVVDAPDLVLPHPRMAERAFVLVPLAEVAPEWRHPLLGRTARELLVSAGAPERVERWGDLPPFGSGPPAG
ncbi:MAG TPA: 2-amino-4-hydroxy-6-hydroxymethyldihydropteridine diphosphokinase [Longimicrobiaceae bacterium]